jgi:hypothetical protein
MAWTDYWKNQVLDRALAGGSAITVTASLHSASPGSTGANEITGGSPAYARKTLAWASAGATTAGAKNTNATVSFDVPACTVQFVGYWAGTNFLGYKAVDPVTFTGQDVYALTVLQWNLNAVASA